MRPPPPMGGACPAVPSLLVIEKKLPQLHKIGWQGPEAGVEPTPSMLGRPRHPTGTLKERGSWPPARIRFGCEHHLTLRWKARAVIHRPGFPTRQGLAGQMESGRNHQGFAAVSHDGSLAHRSNAWSRGIYYCSWVASYASTRYFINPHPGSGLW